MEGYKLLSARFTDNQRLTVEALWTNGTETVAEYCQAADNDAMWTKLLTHITLEEIHENTYLHIKQKTQEVQDVLILIAKEKGWIYDLDQASNSEIYKAIVKVLTAKFDPEKHKEQLFLLKLELFEQDAIKNSTDKELKKKLRKSATTVEAIKAAIEIIEAVPETAPTTTPD